MGIKYHQYGCGNDYGDDHYLTDNWNPDYDYGSQYVEVYFNINTPSYMHAKDSSAFGFASLKKWIRSHMMLTEQYRFLWSNRKG